MVGTAGTEKGKTMDDYIKREDAIKAFDPQQRRDWYTPWIVETLEDLPSADVAPVRHGRWIECTSSPHWKCSICGTKASIWFDESDDVCEWLSDYCPNCGAKMDKGE